VKFSLFLRILPVVAGLVAASFVLFGTLDAFVYHEGVARAFLAPGLWLAAFSIVGLAVARGSVPAVSIREALMLVACSWALLGGLAAIPFRLISRLSWTDAVFESVSGITTTGATVMSGLDQMPHALLLYRQFIQWVGGLGVIIFLVAIAPALNVGGMRLFKLEVPGPMKEEKLVPRASNAARYLWGVYALLTVLCAAAYYLAGMSGFDAIAHSFTTLSTGGFSPHDASIGFFANPAIEWVAIVFMLAGAINFALHLGVIRARNPAAYWRNEESRGFLTAFLVGGVIAALLLWNDVPAAAYGDDFRLGMFHAASFITSTGFVSGDVAAMPLAFGFAMILLAYLGGCSGSTAGGTKVVRWIITLKALYAELRQLLHPSAIFTTRYQGQSVSSDIFRGVYGFLFFYMLIATLALLLLLADGLDPWSAFSAVSATLNCSGPGFGELSSNFAALDNPSTWVLSVLMLLGRMELMTILVLFSPVYWRS
jgi:trk system potassium uptake protein TrkH